MDIHRQSPWTVDQSQVLKDTNSQLSGLTDAEVKIRQRDGANELAAKPPKSLLQMLQEQVCDSMIMILIGAATSPKLPLYSLLHYSIGQVEAVKSGKKLFANFKNTSLIED